MNSFHPDDYTPALAELVRGDRDCPLDAGSPDRARYAELAETLTVADAFRNATVCDQDMAALCCGAVWLLHNYLDEGHTIFQTVESPSGSYWHGIMHRREGDYSNAKYWIRRAAGHPVLDTLIRQTADPLLAEAQPKGQAAWDPFLFVDRCQSAAHQPGADEKKCRKIQQREWELLFDYCFRHATGS